MLSKCANPACSTPFLYLHAGKLFRIEVECPAPPQSAPEAKKPARRLEYFWLCDACAKAMTLKYIPGYGVTATSFALAPKVAS